jgi:hypothetical protein
MLSPSQCMRGREAGMRFVADIKADPSSTTVSLAITKPDFDDAHAWLAVADTTTVSAETLTLVFGPEGMPERDRSDYDPEHQLDALTTPSEDGAAARCDRKCIVGGRGAAGGGGSCENRGAGPDPRGARSAADGLYSEYHPRAPWGASHTKCRRTGLPEKRAACLSGWRRSTQRQNGSFTHG